MKNINFTIILISLTMIFSLLFLEITLPIFDNRGETIWRKDLHTKNLDIFKSKIKESFPYPSKFTIAQVRDLLATSRKSVIPIMEHFDNTGVTQRFGDFRRLRVK